MTVIRGLPVHPHAGKIRTLLTAALLIFAVTIVIGILNGTDLVDFDHHTLLTHVHTGTLGWLTTSVFAAALWMFGERDTQGRLPSLLVPAGIAAVILYNLAFLTTSGTLRPMLGTLMLLTIIGWAAWTVGARSGQVMSVPRLGILAALATSVVGGLLGVLLGIMIATGNAILPGDGYASHPATMVIGFLIPAGMALAERHLDPASLDVPATMAGRLQIGLPFVGGLCVTAGLLADAPPLVALSLPFEVIGYGIFVKRMWPRLRRVRVADGNAGLLAAPTVLWLGLNVLLFVYLIARYSGDFDQVSMGTILALDHMMFIGVMSNSLFAQVREAAGAVKPGAVKAFFWMVNLGLAGFVIGLLFDITFMKVISTPVMGLGLLHGIATFVIALRRPPIPEGSALGPRT